MKLLQSLWTMRGGVHPEFNKSLSNQRPILTLPIPPELIIPLQQAYGDRPRLLVKVGDSVLKGQPLTTAEKKSLNTIIHARTSGRISAIKNHTLPHPSGMSGLCVFIATDGLDNGLDQYSLSGDALQKIAMAGIVGLGGAAFPSANKLSAAAQAGVETLVINAAECEPYISCDDRLIRDRAHEIMSGIKILVSLLHVKQCLIGIEDNKPEAIQALQSALADDDEMASVIGVITVPTQYPSGDVRQLIHLLTGIKIPKGSHAVDSGVLCHNIATAYAVYQAVVHHVPQLSRVVTMTGNGLSQPQNVEVLIGTPISYIVSQLGGYTKQAECMIMGGPMMGFALPTDELPITKISNCILITSKAQLPLTTHADGDDTGDKQIMPCIRCNKCAQACPVNLLPQQLYWHAKARDFEKVSEHHLMDCIECGACSYVCPSRIPLVDYFRFAKSSMQAQQSAADKSTKARERFEFNEWRKARNKQEREAKRKAYKESLQKKKAAEALLNASNGNNDAAEIKTAKQDAIKAAMERAKAKKAALKAAQQKDKHNDAV